MAEILIKNGRVICPGTNRDEIADIWIRDGLVEKIERGGARGRPPGTHNVGRRRPADARAPIVVDATGLIVAPGFIDLHVHLREPGREDCETIESGCAAAAAGGFTAVCAMPNTRPVNDNVATTQFIVERARSRARVRVFPIAAVSQRSQGEVLTDFESLMKAGVVAFSDDGHPVKTETLMREGLQVAKQLGTFISDHCEDPVLSGNGVIHDGAVARQLQLPGLPREAEDSVVARDILLSEETGGRVHIAHLSTAGALQMVFEARQRGVPVTCEATPHHFSLTEEAVNQYGSNAKMKPPLRTHEDVEAILEGLVNGTIDVIATDHAPHSSTEKNQGLASAPFGVTGLETALPLAVKNLIRGKRITWARLIELLSTNPAKILGRGDLGRIILGGAADLTLIDPDQEWVFEVKNSLSKSQNSPFDGWKFTGKVVATLVGGQWAYFTVDARADMPLQA